MNDSSDSKPEPAQPIFDELLEALWERFGSATKTPTNITDQPGNAASETGSARKSYGDLIAAKWQRQAEELATFEDLVREFDQSPADTSEPPAGWAHMWWWARAFGVEDQVESYLQDGDHPVSTRSVPPDQPVFGADAPPLYRTQPERLYAIVNFFERLDPAQQPAESAREYLAVRDFATGSLGRNVDEIYRWLDEHAPPVGDTSLDEIEPPTMELDPSTPDETVAPPSGRRRRRTRDDDESGPVPVEPVAMELDPGNTPDGADSAIDDSDDRGRVILDRPVGAIHPPKPLGPGEWTGPRPPTEGAAAVGLPSAETTAPPETGPMRESRPVPLVTNPNSKDSIHDPPELPFDAGDPEQTDSAVDDSEPTGRSGRGLDVPPFTPPPPAPPSAIDSAPDDSDGVTPLASTGGQRGGGVLDTPRRKVLAALGTVLLLAAIATTIFTGDNKDATDEFAIAPTPSATVESGTAVDPTVLPTEEPTMTIAPVSQLIICSNDPSASFSGFVQPDGTVLDADTGEPRACPGSDN